MKGSEIMLLQFMDSASNRYIIPVYQRKYSWKIDNCRQLYDDLKKMIVNQRSSHFFGSIVSSVVPNGSKVEYHIIDGQQRLTTITLLLLAMRNLIVKGRLLSQENSLADQINERFLISKWADEGDKIKLRPVKSDRVALEKLFAADEEEYDLASNLTINYQYFCDILLKQEVMVEQLYGAINKLQIISITLERDDNAQLIFESLNSTGLALSEGDKIRNYILMGLSPEDQYKYYDKYWAKIERCTEDDVSNFVRDYLSIKQQMTPTISNVYQAFKKYVSQAQISTEPLLEDLLRYARLYEKLLKADSGLKDDSVDACLYRMKRLEITVTRPFFMEVLRLNKDGKLSNGEVREILSLTESYLFRRNICDVPTNALNKIFLTLNKEVIRYDNSTDNYVEKLKYALLNKKESGRFPNDEEFVVALSNKQVYNMRGKYRAYLFERYENDGTLETKDVYKHFDNHDYSIEHIMPQTLTPYWIDALGDHAVEIHANWKDRLANLTLTAYNSNLSNKTFEEKRDILTKGGYQGSGLRMNQAIASKTSWGLAELEERDRAMTARAKEIWPYPTTLFKPAEKEFDSCILDDEDIDLTGRDIVKYSYQNYEQSVSSWTDMFEHVVRYLHQKDKSILSSLAYSTDSDVDLNGYVSTNPDDLRNEIEIDEKIYIEGNTSTMMKVSILRRLFALYDADPMDLVFYLKDPDSEKEAEIHRYELRKRYWAYALPVIQAQNAERGTFDNVHPGSSNTVSGHFGFGGFAINCIANYDSARVELYLASGDKEKNKVAYDQLSKHRSEIEQTVGASLHWERAEDKKASWISYSLQGVSIGNEADWSRMARFHAEWSDKILGAMLPYLNNGADDGLDPVVSTIREWALQKEGVNIKLAKCNGTYTRFTTNAMSEILPDLENAPSGWNTANHYFYEVVTRKDRPIFIQFALSAKNANDEFRQICDQINDFYPSKYKDKEDWLWRTPFKTTSFQLTEDVSKADIFIKLDACLDEIIAFEKDLKDKLQIKC